MISLEIKQGNCNLFSQTGPDGPTHASCRGCIARDLGVARPRLMEQIDTIMDWPLAWNGRLALQQVTTVKTYRSQIVSRMEPHAHTTMIAAIASVHEVDIII